MKQEMMGWQWHQLDHMQIICTWLRTDNHASTSSLNFYSPWMLFLMPSQPRQKTLKAISFFLFFVIIIIIYLLNKHIGKKQ